MPTPSAATSEWLTRKRIIDGKLRAAGWEVVPFKKAKDLRLSNTAIEEFETGNGPADWASLKALSGAKLLDHYTGEFAVQ